MDGVQSSVATEKAEQKEKIAKEYGIDLSNIRHIKMDDGKEFFQFIDPKTNDVRMVENINYNSDLKEQFEESQKNLNMSQGDNAQENAENMFKHNLKYKNKETELLSMEDFKSNGYSSKKKIRETDTIARNKIIALLKKKDDLDLEYINIEHGFGIDEDNNVIDVKYDFINNKAEFVEPETISYSSSLSSENDLSDDTVDLSNVDFDSILDGMGIVDNIPEVTEAKEMNVNGVTINSKTIAQAYDTPEIIDRDESLNNNQRIVYRTLLDRIRARFTRRQGNTNQRQFVLTQNRNTNTDRDAA